VFFFFFFPCHPPFTDIMKKVVGIEDKEETQEQNLNISR